MKGGSMTKEMKKRIMWLAFSHATAITVGIMIGRVWS
jgi:hypothetical protein